MGWSLETANWFQGRGRGNSLMGETYTNRFHKKLSHFLRHRSSGRSNRIWEGAALVVDTYRFGLAGFTSCKRVFLARQTESVLPWLSESIHEPPTAHGRNTSVSSMVYLDSFWFLGVQDEFPKVELPTPHLPHVHKGVSRGLLDDGLCDAGYDWRNGFDIGVI